MSAHTHTASTPGCYRCELNLDEMAAIQAEDERDAQEAWLKYRDAFAQLHLLNKRQAVSRLRRREFITGFLLGRQS